MSRTFTIRHESADESAMQRALSNKHYIRESQRANPNPNEEIAPMLTNITERLNSLAVLSPRNEYFAGNAVCTSLGYTLINQMLWAYRKQQQALRAPAPSIDIFNDGYADQYEQRDSEANLHNIGAEQLPSFDALPLIGVYKSLLFMQRGNLPFAQDFPVRMPNEILHEMHTRENDDLLQAAYEAQAQKEIAGARASAMIQQEIDKQAKAQQQRNEPKNKREMDHILGELQRACPDQLTDEKWKAIPMWAQYKLTTSIFRQVVKAIAADARTTVVGDDTRDRLIELCNEMHLELESAARAPEIKLAFKLERLNERHEILKAPKAEQKQEQAS